jgi:hypothetical protein
MGCSAIEEEEEEEGRDRKFVTILYTVLTETVHENAE